MDQEVVVVDVIFPCFVSSRRYSEPNIQKKSVEIYEIGVKIPEESKNLGSKKLGCTEVL